MWGGGEPSRLRERYARLVNELVTERCGLHTSPLQLAYISFELRLLVESSSLCQHGRPRCEQADKHMKRYREAKQVFTENRNYCKVFLNNEIKMVCLHSLCYKKNKIESLCLQLPHPA